MISSSTKDDESTHHPLLKVEARLDNDSYRSGFLQQVKAALARQHAHFCGD